jgi:hypothetical protein
MSMACAQRVQNPGRRIEQRGLDITCEGLAAIDRRVPGRKRGVLKTLKCEVHQGIVITPKVEGYVDLNGERYSPKKRYVKASEASAIAILDKV